MLSLFIALGIFGLGVTIVDFFGLLGHHDSGGHQGAAHDSGGHGLIGHADHGAVDHGSAVDHGGMTDHDGAAHHGGDNGGAHGGAADHGGVDHGDVHGALAAAHGTHGGDASHAAFPGDAHHMAAVQEHGHAADDRSSLLGAGDAKARAVGRIVMVLRMTVYFSLGAGLTGIVATAGGIASVPSLLWSIAGGILTSVVSRLVRRVARRDMDSSLTAADFIMAEAEIVIPVEAGKLGKARVRRYGTDRDLYVRCHDAETALAVGTRVRIVDFSDECYFVEAL